MKKSRYLLLFLLVASTTAFATDHYLCNYLGSGVDPELHIRLENNGGDSWGNYAAGYGNCRNDIGAKVPLNPGTNGQWSAWNIYDEKNKYYGTVTLINDGKQVTIKNYSNTTNNGYYIDGLGFEKEPNNTQASQWILSVKGKIVRPSDANTGPFPSTKQATVAVYKADPSRTYTLAVKGNSLVDNDNNPVILKGFARPSLEWSKTGEHLSEKDILNMKSWGANTIRLSLFQKSWFESADISVKGSYKQIVDAIVRIATDNGMAVILDLHWTDKQSQPSMANKESVQFWKSVANQYKGFGTVIFELFNEPVNISKDVWLHGNDSYSGYQQLYDAVRSTGATNPCIVNGLEYGFDLGFIKSDSNDYTITGNNVVYGSHPYNRNYDQIKTSLAGVVERFPIIYTEFGDNNPADYGSDSWQSAYDSALAYINEHHGNYTAWAWWVQPDNPAFPVLISDWDKGTPVFGGKIVKADMTAMPVNSLPITSQ